MCWHAPRHRPAGVASSDSPRPEQLGRRRPGLAPRQHPLDWVNRYGRRSDESRLPGAETERQAFACQVGEDGHFLLAAAYRPGSPSWLAEVPAVETLRRVWLQQFAVDSGRVSWRTEAEGIPPASRFISSPYDVEARYGKKRSTSWVGYKVHLTETCEDKAPHLIVHVATTPAPVADGEVTPAIHEASGASLLPSKHIADTAYLDAELLADSRREFGVNLIGPTHPITNGSPVRVKVRGERVHDQLGPRERDLSRGPDKYRLVAGRRSRPQRGDQDQVLGEGLRGMPIPPRCTKTTRRSITVRPRDQHEALTPRGHGRRRRSTEPNTAGGPGSRGRSLKAVRSFGLRRSRYVGEAKAHVQHVATAAAINIPG